jgi:spoIIIJ-associated protein
MSGPDFIETEGETVDDAVAHALSSLALDRSDVDIDILSNPSRGLFGLGGRKARVRVTRRTLGTSPTRTGDGTASPPAPRAGGGDGAAAAALGEHARTLLEDLLGRMGFECSVSIEAGEDTPTLQIAGDQASVLIGKHGQTLDALEYILNRIVSREEELASRFHLDCEQYRVKRKRSLEELAQRVAAQVKQRGRSVLLSPMSPRDRRIVHLVLQGDPDLTTRSSGEGSYRRLEILPQGEPSRGRSRPR